jgi:ABC-type Fe3+-citrate transport system substrate-binding protein
MQNVLTELEFDVTPTTSFDYNSLQRIVRAAEHLKDVSDFAFRLIDDGAAQLQNAFADDDDLALHDAQTFAERLLKALTDEKNAAISLKHPVLEIIAAVEELQHFAREADQHTDSPF